MSEAETYDYIIVGGGAAGCVVAARLAGAGHQVLVLEAGDDPVEPKVSIVSDRPAQDDYHVPAFHAFASEHPALKWDFWVRHYADDCQQRKDKKYYECYRDERVDGVLYPRSSGLGGCAGHNAMIIVRPPNADWNHIAQLTGDVSWRASKMQDYFRRIERCRYGNPLWRALACLGFNPTGHGFKGWLTTERGMPLRLFRDLPLKRAIKNAVLAATALLPKAAERWGWLISGEADPNDQRLIDKEAWGLSAAPLSTASHARSGPRERLLAMKEKHRDRLTVLLNALVTRIEIDPETKAAVAAHVVQGSHLYRAAARPNGTPSPPRRFQARREIILSGGAFNSPQLLMLSGVGDPEHLGAMGLATVVDLPGVGRNLQDRYEIAVVSRMKRPWETLRGCEYRPGDRPHVLWRRWRLGPYVSNGALFSIAFPSRANRGLADVFCFGLLAKFHGYFPGYSDEIKKQDYLTWAVLKAYTNNLEGFVRLRSADPLDRPGIQFSYFQDRDAEADLYAMVEGVRFVRKVADSLGHLIKEETIPGRNVYTDEDIKQFIRDNAWGHHACGSCAMKPRAMGGVVDSEFRVYGVRNLRVVDASVFPRIPGYFIVASVYMIAEKAADVILASIESDCARRGEAESAAKRI
jgi:choline dehydrogenase